MSTTTKGLDELLEQIKEMEKTCNIADIKEHLTSYHNFIPGIKKTIATIEDKQSFDAFRQKWQNTTYIGKLPKELAAFNHYMSLISQYNDLIIPVYMRGEKIEGHKPIFLNEDLLSVSKLSSMIYARPFNWAQIKNCLIGQPTRNAVYTHTVAALPPKEIIDMIKEGRIKQSTIEALPYAVSTRGVNGNGRNDDALRQNYHNHLATVYDSMGKTLPDVIEEVVPVKGVTFEGRPQKLRYLANKLKETDRQPIEVIIKLEPYTFTKDGVSEPAMRVVATLPGDASFRSLDIGNIDRNLAISIATEHEGATVVGELEEVGSFETDDNKNSVYAKLTLQIADKPYEKEKEQSKDENRSEEVDALFEEELK
jgi:hypothetical protein